MKRHYAVVFIALVAIFGLLLAVRAEAAPLTPELETDYSSALAWWGVVSPPQCASVTAELLPTDPFSAQDGIDAAARATQPKPGETEVACHLYVFEPVSSGCVEEMVIRHEVGHLLGYGHSKDPDSIMHEGINFEYWCPDRIDNLRWKHIVQQERCFSLPSTTSKTRLETCWKKSRRILAALLRIIGRESQS